VKRNYYYDLSVDYSTSKPVSPEISDKLIDQALKYVELRENDLPDITSEYNLKIIEDENRDWWPTHCEALRQGRGDILTNEYAQNLVYLCTDGPFYGRDAGTDREAHWWAILAQSNVTMVWPIVMFQGEVVYFEWNCNDNYTNEIIARGSVTWLRRGHRGACYIKCEQLTFFRDVYASSPLLDAVQR
jgi:hypothetical protein